MQGYAKVTNDDKFTIAFEQLLRNQSVILSQSSGGAFPTDLTEEMVGMQFFHTTQLKIYTLRSVTPEVVWILLYDVSLAVAAVPNAANLSMHPIDDFMLLDGTQKMKADINIGGKSVINTTSVSLGENGKFKINYNAVSDRLEFIVNGAVKAALENNGDFKVTVLKELESI